MIVAIVVIIYIAWSLTQEHHTWCECPDCDNCPFPKCKGCEK